jgi:hypothetical protein
MGLDYSASFRFAMQLNCNAFIEQISIENFVKVANLFINDCILFDEIDIDDIYDITRESNTDIENKVIRLQKKLQKYVKKSNKEFNVLVYDPHNKYCSDSYEYGDSNTINTIEELDANKANLIEYANTLGFANYKIVTVLTSRLI